jgi:chemotaxis protein histidine kinase CheA
VNLVSTPQVLDPMTAEEVARYELGKAMEVLTLAKAVVIKSEDDYRAADAAVASIKSAAKAVEAKRTDLVKPLNDTVKKINAGFKPVSEALDQALECYRKPMSAFQAEQARIRAEAERERQRLEAEARAKAEAEMAAARRAAEEAEAARKAAQVEDPMEALLAEEDAADAERKAAEARAQAEQSIRAIATIEPPVPVPAKVTGAASRTTTVWKYEVTDEALVPLSYRPIDHAALARDVRALKGEAQIPGVRVYSDIEVK